MASMELYQTSSHLRSDAPCCVSRWTHDTELPDDFLMALLDVVIGLRFRDRCRCHLIPRSIGRFQSVARILMPCLHLTLVRRHCPRQRSCRVSVVPVSPIERRRLCVNILIYHSGLIRVQMLWYPYHQKPKWRLVCADHATGPMVCVQHHSFESHGQCHMKMWYVRKFPIAWETPSHRPMWDSLSRSKY